MRQIAATLEALSPEQMLDMVGGMDALAPTAQTGFWYDVCWCLGRVAAGAVYLVTADRPPSDFAYAKVGYGS